MESRTIDYKILDKRYEIEEYRHDEDDRREMRKNDDKRRQKEKGIESCSLKTIIIIIVVVVVVLYSFSACSVTMQFIVTSAEGLVACRPIYMHIPDSDSVRP